MTGPFLFLWPRPSRRIRLSRLQVSRCASSHWHFDVCPLNNPPNMPRGNPSTLQPAAPGAERVLPAVQPPADFDRGVACTTVGKVDVLGAAVPIPETTTPAHSSKRSRSTQLKNQLDVHALRAN